MRVCLLTGAAGLLGTHFIDRYADRYIIAAVRHRIPLQSTRAAMTCMADVRDRAAIAAMVDEVARALGRIDLVVNAAAASLRWREPATALDHYSDVLAVNIAGPAFVTAAVAARCWQAAEPRSRRHVVNISSISGHEVYEDDHDLAYPASKAALNMLTIQQAIRLGPLGVRANAVAPTTFPRLIPVARVSDAIVALDDGTDTGRIRVIDQAGEYWLGEQPEPPP